jgi:DNA-directed RNA polymerase specialized sigma24 family protein
LQARFAVEDGMAYMDSVSTEPAEDDVKRIEQVRKIMEMLPPREADFIDLYYFRGLTQTDIANIFQVSQPTVCYRLQRATARIQFLLELPDISEDEIREELRKALDDELDVEIMILMFKTTCQSEVAKILRRSQGLVRHRFIRSLERLRDHKGLRKVVELYDYIYDNLNILREVRRFGQDEEVVYMVA